MQKTISIPAQCVTTHNTTWQTVQTPLQTFPCQSDSRGTLYCPSTAGRQFWIFTVVVCVDWLCVKSIKCKKSFFMCLEAATQSKRIFLISSSLITKFGLPPPPTTHRNSTSQQRRHLSCIFLLDKSKNNN